MNPGTYSAHEGESDFGELLAMIAAGDALLLGESYDAEGRKHVVAEVSSLRRNGSDLGEAGFQLGELWFSNVLRDYQNNFGEKWWREAIQNAVDAGAKHVVCSVQPTAEGHIEVSIEDDGSGMSQEVLVGAFLTGGGTTKQEGSSTFGGFGRAKELLILPWIRYEIHTRDLLIASRQAERAPLQRVTRRVGTRLTVVMPASKHATAADAAAYIKRCDLPGVKFTVNEERFVANLARRNQPVREKAYAVRRDDGSTGHFTVKIFYDEKNTSYPWEAQIRLNGLFMFDQWISNKPKGLVLVEIEGAAKDVLTSNRDSFSSSEVRRDLDDFAQEVSREKEQALRKKSGMVREKYTGGGKFQAQLDTPRRSEDAALREASILEIAGPMDGEISQAALQEIVRSMDGYREQQDPSAVLSFAQGDAMAAIIESVMHPRSGERLGSDVIETLAKQLAWSPDYYLVNDVEGFKVRAKFRPESMTREVRTLLRVWAEMCRFVLCLLGCARPFGVGFVFSRSSLAEYRKEEGEEWLMLNPLPQLAAHQEDPDLIDLSDPHQLLELYASAVHEVTHMANQCSFHDSDFAAALTANMAKTYGKDREIKRIVAAVRKQERETSTSPREKSPRKLPALRGWKVGGSLTGSAGNQDLFLLALYRWSTPTTQETRYELVQFNPYEGSEQLAAFGVLTQDSVRSLLQEAGDPHSWLDQLAVLRQAWRSSDPRIALQPMALHDLRSRWEDSPLWKPELRSRLVDAGMPGV